MTPSPIDATLPGLRCPGGRQPVERKRPHGDSYRRGAAVERRFVAWLRAHGWTPVRSANSRGPADVWATRPEGLGLFQVKVTEARPTPGEREKALAALRTVDAPPGTRKELVWWDTRGRCWQFWSV